MTEFVIGVGLSSLMIIVLASFAMFHGKGMASMFNYMELNQSSQQALNDMVKEIRGTADVTNSSSTTITLIAPSGALTTYIYDRRPRTLSRIKDGRTNVLLRGCDKFAFTMESSDVTNGTFNCSQATNVLDCKAVSLSFTCSRTVLGNDTDSPQPHITRVVLRN